MLLALCISCHIQCYAIIGLNFTWLCREEFAQDPDISDKAGCYYRAGDEESPRHKLRVNSSLLAENTSYFITVQVTKDERQAQYTQEVFIVPGDPVVVQIRYVNHDTIEELQLHLWFLPTMLTN